MLKSSTSISSTQTHRHLAKYFPEQPNTLSLDVKILKWNRSILLGFILRKDFPWQTGKANYNKGGYCDITNQKSRFKLLKLKNVSHS